jgi:hypothetical protein
MGYWRNPGRSLATPAELAQMYRQAYIDNLEVTGVSGTHEDGPRVYAPGRPVAHLLDGSATEYALTLCGAERDGRGWWGTGSQDEIDKAAALPLCTGCQVERHRLARLRLRPVDDYGRPR